MLLRQVLSSVQSLCSLLLHIGTDTDNVMSYLMSMKELIIITQYTERQLKREEHEHIGQIIHIEDIVNL